MSLGTDSQWELLAKRQPISVLSLGRQGSALGGGVELQLSPSKAQGIRRELKISEVSAVLPEMRPGDCIENLALWPTRPRGHLPGSGGWTSSLAKYLHIGCVSSFYGDVWRICISAWGQQGMLFSHILTFDHSYWRNFIAIDKTLLGSSSNITMLNYTI